MAKPVTTPPSHTKKPPPPATAQNDVYDVATAFLVTNEEARGGDAYRIETSSLLANDGNLIPTFYGLGSSSATTLMSANGAILTSANGVISYDAGTKFDYLGQGETAIDSFTYTTLSKNGALSTAQVTLLIKGTNDAPTIIVSAAPVVVVENSTAANTTTATLLVQDIDQNAVLTYETAGWTAVVGSTTQFTKLGTYGTATLDTPSGTVSYALDNTNTATSALNTGDHVTDNFEVAVSDGSVTGSTTVVFGVAGYTDHIPSLTRFDPISVGFYAAVDYTEGSFFWPGQPASDGGGMNLYPSFESSINVDRHADPTGTEYDYSRTTVHTGYLAFDLSAVSRPITEAQLSWVGDAWDAGNVGTHDGVLWLGIYAYADDGVLTSSDATKDRVLVGSSQINAESGQSFNFALDAAQLNEMLDGASNVEFSLSILDSYPQTSDIVPGEWSVSQVTSHLSGDIHLSLFY